MKEKAFLGIVAVIAASVVIPVKTFEVRLVTSPAEDATYVPAGEPFNVTCEGLGDYDGKFSFMRWLDKEEKIIPEGVPGVKNVGKNSVRLIFTSPKISQSGVYKCSAIYDGKHTLEKSIKIFFYGNETDDNGTSSILKVEVRNITSTSVKFFIAVSGSVKSIEVKYREARDKSKEHVMEWDYGDNYEVKDLIPSGRYTFQFRTKSSENKEWSQSYTVTLLPDKPEIIFQYAQGGTVKLEWFIKVDDIMRGTIEGYELKYFTVRMQGGNYWVPSTCATTIKIPSCGGTSYTIAGLVLKQHYEIQLRARTASGYGETYKQKVYPTL